MGQRGGVPPRAHSLSKGRHGPKVTRWPATTPPADDEFARSLIAYCRDHLAHMKCPKSIDFTDALPRLPTGKLYKRALRDAYWQGRGKSRIV